MHHIMPGKQLKIGTKPNYNASGSRQGSNCGISNIGLIYSYILNNLHCTYAGSGILMMGISIRNVNNRSVSVPVFYQSPTS